METTQKTNRQNRGDYLSKMLTFFVALSILQAVVIAFLIFRGSESEDTSSEVLSPDTLSLQTTPTPGLGLAQVAQRTNPQKQNPQRSSQPTPTPKPVPKTQKFNLDKTYNFPITDVGGNSSTDIEFKILSYELTNQVTVNNFYKAIVTNDKEILVFNIELTNDEDTKVNIMAGDYLRLTKNGEEKLIAPDIDSDPVEVRPQSTKNTKLGFTLFKNDSDITVEVGELGGDKEAIEIR
jgi:hypothetical protein